MVVADVVATEVEDTGPSGSGVVEHGPPVSLGMGMGDTS